jgi:hypothetical protein
MQTITLITAILLFNINECRLFLTTNYQTTQYRPDLLCIHGTPYLGNPSTHLDPSVTIQFIEFTYTNDQYPEDKINAKISKYLPLINDIQMKGWKVAPLIVITAGTRGTIHNPTIQTLRTIYKFKKLVIKKILINITTSAIQHLSSTILHKRSLENN